MSNEFRVNDILVRIGKNTHAVEGDVYLLAKSIDTIIEHTKKLESENKELKKQIETLEKLGETSEDSVH